MGKKVVNMCIKQRVGADGRRGPRKRDVLRMLLEDYLRCSGGLAKQATGRKPVVCALCTHRPGGASEVASRI
jgi:hypothetical protein